MKVRHVVAMGVVFALLPLQLATSDAQTAAVTVWYRPGWNLAGGPAGTDFSAASVLDGYTTGTYFTPSPPAAALCQGYWAYFPAATTVSLASTATGPTQQCQLAAGWNLVGNPFAGGAVLPTNFTAYYWNARADAYQVVGVIPPGGAVWIDAGAATVAVLRYQATTVR